MGEYAKRKIDDEEIKIGTCESMYFLRFEDRNKVEQVEYSLDVMQERGLFYRLPLPEEDHIQPGDYDGHLATYRLYKVTQEATEHQQMRFEDFSDDNLDPGRLHLSHPSGLNVHIPCYHGARLPDSTDDIKFGWNGKSWSFELRFIKHTHEGTLRPVVWCRHCGEMWSCDWEEIIDYTRGEFRTRLEAYAAYQEGGEL